MKLLSVGKFQQARINVLVLVVILYTPVIISTFDKSISLMKYGFQNANKTAKIKYILLWSANTDFLLVSMYRDQFSFLNKNNFDSNCYITTNRDLLRDVSDFDAVVFSEEDIKHFDENKLPIRRSIKQKYVYASAAPKYNSLNIPKYFNGFFNWTWTYKLNSDLWLGDMVIRNENGEIIGPATHIDWLTPDQMLPVSEELKKILNAKEKIIAGFMPSSKTAKTQRKYIIELEKELKERYNIQVDFYGYDGTGRCPDERENDCFEVIQDYCFYLVFEDNRADDYVSDNLLNAIRYYAIPVVYGGANYRRFLPDGSYFNAMEIHPKLLAQKIVELTVSLENFLAYHKWRNHYVYNSISDNLITNDYYRMCILLNDNEEVRNLTYYENFVDWMSCKVRSSVDCCSNKHFLRSYGANITDDRIIFTRRVVSNYIDDVGPSKGWIYDQFEKVKRFFRRLFY